MVNTSIWSIDKCLRINCPFFETVSFLFNSQFYEKETILTTTFSPMFKPNWEIIMVFVGLVAILKPFIVHVHYKESFTKIILHAQQSHDLMTA